MQFEVGKIYEGTVKGITQYGAFVELDKNTTGMVHISEISSAYVNDIKDYLKENQLVKVKILGVNDAGKISLSIKKAADNENKDGKSEQHPRNNNRHDNHYNRNNNNNNRADRNSAPNVWEPKKQTPPAEMSFEDMLSKFKQHSEEKMGDIKRNMENKRRSSSRRGR